MPLRTEVKHLITATIFFIIGFVVSPSKTNNDYTNYYRKSTVDSLLDSLYFSYKLEVATYKDSIIYEKNNRDTVHIKIETNNSVYDTIKKNINDYSLDSLNELIFEGTGQYKPHML